MTDRRYAPRKLHVDLACDDNGGFHGEVTAKDHPLAYFFGSFGDRCHRMSVYLEQGIRPRMIGEIVEAILDELADPGGGAPRIDVTIEYTLEVKTRPNADTR